MLWLWLSYLYFPIIYRILWEKNQTVLFTTWWLTVWSKYIFLFTDLMSIIGLGESIWHIEFPSYGAFAFFKKLVRVIWKIKKIKSKIRHFYFFFLYHLEKKKKVLAWKITDKNLKNFRVPESCIYMFFKMIFSWVLLTTSQQSVKKY